MDNTTQACIGADQTNAIANKDADSANVPAYPARNPTLIRAVQAHTELGHTQTQTAVALGVSQSTVSRILADWQPTAGLARKRLEASALDAAEDWVEASKAGAKQGNHRAAKELLQAVGVVQQDASSVNQFAVFVGDGQTAIGPAPTFAPEVVEGVISCNTPSPTAERVSD